MQPVSLGRTDTLVVIKGNKETLPSSINLELHSQRGVGTLEIDVPKIPEELFLRQTRLGAILILAWPRESHIYYIDEQRSYRIAKLRGRVISCETHQLGVRLVVNHEGELLVYDYLTYANDLLLIGKFKPPDDTKEIIIPVDACPKRGSLTSGVILVLNHSNTLSLKILPNERDKKKENANENSEIKEVNVSDPSNVVAIQKGNKIYVICQDMVEVLSMTIPKE